MKNNTIKKVGTLFLFLLLVGVQSTQAQFWKKIKERVKDGVEEAVLRKTEEKTVEKTENAIDSIFETPKKIGKRTKREKKNKEDENMEESSNQDEEYGEFDEEGNISGEFEIYSKFDFVPGNKILLFDDFSIDNIGDFPSKWNTNGSGEVVTINEALEKWFEMKSGSTYIPDLPQDLPEEYTIEFNVLATGLDRQTSSNALLSIILDDNNTFKYGKDYVHVRLPFVQYIDMGIRINNKILNQKTIENKVKNDLRKIMLAQPHISIAVNKQRFRLWINEKKYIDIPRIIGKSTPIKALKFELTGFKNDKDRLFVTNLKVAEGGQDLRSKLLNEGRYSTTGILFNSGSDQIKPASNGILKQIANALQQEPTMNLTIIGHTDADGDTESNLLLSEQRAASVKTILVLQFGIDESRLQTEGKGESMPVSDNNTPEGKANNRRVEFVTITE